MQVRKRWVKLLLAKGADVQARNKSRLTAADKAVMNKHYEVTVLLLKTGKVQLKEVLLPALRYGNVRIAREIVESSAENPLHGSWLVIACQSGNIELVRLVLAKGADPNYESGQPLLEASFDAPLEQ